MGSGHAFETLNGETRPLSAPPRGLDLGVSILGQQQEELSLYSLMSDDKTAVALSSASDTAQAHSFYTAPGQGFDYLPTVGEIQVKDFQVNTEQSVIALQESDLLQGVSLDRSFLSNGEHPGADDLVENVFRQDPLVGKLLGNYRLLEKIGQGGFAAVYKAEQINIKQMFAIKILYLHRQSPEVLERFRREARMLAMLEHENIVNVADFGYIDDKAFYLAMELVEGQSLQQYLRSNSFFSLSRIESLVTQLCTVLHYAHGKGVLHRDVKPSNILITEDQRRGERLKLIDFGVASIAEENNELTQSGTCLGSPGYMSPEQAKGDVRSLDCRTDLYSVGVILYQLLTGKRPIEAPNFAAMLTKKLFNKAPSLAEKDSTRPWSPELEALLARVLAVEPKDRPADSMEFLREFQRAMEAQKHLDHHDTEWNSHKLLNRSHHELPAQLEETMEPLKHELLQQTVSLEFTQSILEESSGVDAPELQVDTRPYPPAFVDTKPSPSPPKASWTWRIIGAVTVLAIGALLGWSLFLSSPKINAPGQTKPASELAKTTPPVTSKLPPLTNQAKRAPSAKRTKSVKRTKRTKRTKRVRRVRGVPRVRRVSGFERRGLLVKNRRKVSRRLLRRASSKSWRKRVRGKRGWSRKRVRVRTKRSGKRLRSPSKVSKPSLYGVDDPI